MPNYIKSHGSLNPLYLKRIESTIDKAIAEHPKTIAIRFDLRFLANIDIDSPHYFYNSDASVISRFFDHLKYRVNDDLSTSGIYLERLRYAWGREQDQADKQHYHVFILLNMDNYNSLANDNILRHRLASKIQEAWCRAIGLPVDVFRMLVHFPKHCVYYIHADRAPHEVEEDRAELIYRVSYLAKDKTKHYGNGYRSFGCSQY